MPTICLQKTASSTQNIPFDRGNLKTTSRLPDYEGRGIGCYFDDELHHALGLAGMIGRAFITSLAILQSVEDLRVRSTPLYANLKLGARSP